MIRFLIAAPRRPGLSLLELIAAVGLLGIVAAVLVPRLAQSGRAIDAHGCDRNRETIDLRAALFYRNTGDWPAGDLSDLAADAGAFPNGLPVCPVDGSAYTFDRATGETVAHGH